MTESATLAERLGEEIWESNVPGRTFVPTVNEYGRQKNVSCVGVGSRLRIKTVDRQIAEEGIRKPEHNPFRNGKLTRVDSGSDSLDGDSSQSLKDADLFELFELPPHEFIEAINSLSELNVRRMKEAAKAQDATNSQIEAIQDVLHAKWPLGGSTPTYDEMMGSPDN